MPATTPPDKKLRIFVSYSHKDRTLVDEFNAHAALLRQGDFVEWWDDLQIQPGDKWDLQIHENLERAHIVLLMVSADFLKSQYCYRIELKRALERERSQGVRVIPISLRPCSWEGAPFREYQALPFEAKPIDSAHRTERDLAFTAVVGELWRLVRSMAQTVPAAVTQARRAAHDPGIPRVLPYLCDRSDQETDLVAALSRYDPRRPVVAIIHGHEKECHDRFLERLKVTALPRTLGWDPKQSVQDLPALAWGSHAAGRGATAEVFEPLLANCLGCAPHRAELIRNLANYKTPVILHSTLFTSNWVPAGKNLLPAFLEFWNSWPDLNPGQFLFVALLLKYEDPPRSFWRRLRRADTSGVIRRSLSGELAAKYSRLNCIILPELAAVSRSDAEQWVTHQRVRPFISRDGTEQCFRRIREFYADRSALSMEDLAPCLRQLLGEV